MTSETQLTCGQRLAAVLDKLGIENAHPRLSPSDSGRVGSRIPLWGMTRQPSLGLGA